MSSVPPPPPMGQNGHPRYSQHMERDARGVYGPPSSYGNSYASYPPQPPPPPYGNYAGGPQGPGYPPRGGGYSMQSYPPGYNGGGFPSHQPPYYGGGGYDNGHYGGPPAPGQPQPPPGQPSTFRGPSPVPPTRVPPQSSPEQHSLVSAGSSTVLSKHKTKEAAETKTVPAGETTTTLPDHSEVERLRAAAATELTTEEVKPIQTDFHFFVKEHAEKYRKLAEEEVRKSLGDDSKLDPMLVNSNLNTRLLKAWEGLTKDERDAYMVQEEADRRRFMEDDEIASRHCATLTARGKSPRVVDNTSKTEKAKPKTTTPTAPAPATPAAPAPAPAAPVVAEEKETPPVKEEPKRPVEESKADATPTSENMESPTKKSKVTA